jgi:hypothetical protein
MGVYLGIPNNTLIKNAIYKNGDHIGWNMGNISLYYRPHNAIYIRERVAELRPHITHPILISVWGDKPHNVSVHPKTQQNGELVALQ